MTKQVTPTLKTVGYRVTEITIRRYDKDGNLTLEKTGIRADAAYTLFSEKPGNMAALEAAQLLDGKVTGKDGDVYHIIHDFGERVESDKGEFSLSVESGDSLVVIVATSQEIQDQIQRIKDTHTIYDESLHNTFTDFMKHKPRGKSSGKEKETDDTI